MFVTRFGQEKVFLLYFRRTFDLCTLYGTIPTQLTPSNTVWNTTSGKWLQFKCNGYIGTYIKAAKSTRSDIGTLTKGDSYGRCNKRKQTNKSTHWHAPVTTEARWNWVTCVYLCCSLLDSQIAPWMGKATELPKALRLNMCIFIFHNYPLLTGRNTPI